MTENASIHGQGAFDPFSMAGLVDSSLRPPDRRLDDNCGSFSRLGSTTIVDKVARGAGFLPGCRAGRNGLPSLDLGSKGALF